MCSAAIDRFATMRILDANANRAVEGLRTLEEFARFVLEDRFLSESAKRFRHRLAKILDSLGSSARVEARAVRSDCGTSIELTSEYSRQDIHAVITAAVSRVQESMRCIEEYGKTLPDLDARAIESLRYEIYAWTAALTLGPGRRARLRDAKLYVLMPTSLDVNHYASLVSELFDAGVDVIQLRDKAADDRLLYQCSKVGADVARRLHKCFIVNDRADIAAAANADGVHVGQEELPVEAVRRVMGSNAIVGVSTHDLSQMHNAILDGADYIGCGPTFPSNTKAFDEFKGLDFLQAAAQETTLPAFAIGGIDMKNLASVLASGIHGIAVSSAIMGMENPADAARQFATIMRANLVP